VYVEGRTPGGIGVDVGPPGVTVVETAMIVVMTEFALVGVPAVAVGVDDPLDCGVVIVPVVMAWGVPGVPVPPPAAAVCAAAVCLANSSIIAIGFSTEGKGETKNKFVGITVGVEADGVDKDTSQAVIRVEMVINIMTALKPRCLFIMVSPLSTNST